MKPVLKIIGAVLWLLALALAAWTLWQLPLESIGPTLQALTACDWLLWLLVNLVVILLLTYRWQLLMHLLQARVPFPSLLLIRQAGQAVSFLIPGPHVGGEPLQLYWLCKRSGLTLPTAILGLGLDRLFELACNVLVFIGSVSLLLLTTSLTIPDWQQGALILTVLALLLLWLVNGLQRKPQWLSQRLENAAQHWRQHERLRQFSAQWQSGWLQIRTQFAEALATKKARLLLAALFSALGWFAMLGEFALLLYFLGWTPGLFEVVLLVVAMRVALLIPAPGGIGPVEAGLLWAFQWLDLPLTAAASLIVMMRLRDVAILLAGLLCAYGLGRNADSTPDTR